MAEQIPQYDAPIQDVPRPNPQGYEASIQAARRQSQMAGAIGADITQAVKAPLEGGVALWQSIDQVQAHEEQSKGMLSLANMDATRGTAIQSILENTKGQDTRAALQAFKQQRQASYDQFLDGFQSIQAKEWAREKLAEAQAHDEKTFITESVNSTAKQTILNFQQTANVRVQAAYNNPADLDHLLSMHSSTFDEVLSGIPKTPEIAEAMQKEKQEELREITKSAILGALDKNPAAGAAMLTGGKYAQYLKEGDMSALLSHEREAQRAARLDGHMAHQEHEWAINDANEASMRHLVSTFQYDPQSNAVVASPETAKAILQATTLPAGTPGSLKGETAFTLLNELEKGAGKQQAETKSATFRDLQLDLLRPPEDPQHLTLDKIMGAGYARQITGPEVKELAGQLQSTSAEEKDRISETMKNLSANLNPDGGDPAGAAAVVKAQAFFWDQRRKNQQAGVPWQDSYDPASPNYIFKDTGTEKAPFSQFKIGATEAGANAITATTPVSQFQQKASSAVNFATRVTTLLEQGMPIAQVNKVVNAGLDPSQQRDISQGNWCAQLVNAALESAGIKGTGTNMAADFKNWGFSVLTKDLKAGDVFYSNQGHDHVGLITGVPPRQGPNGQVQVQVVSSHKQGDLSNDGGVEWRDARTLMIRRGAAGIAEAVSNPKSTWQMPAWLSGGSTGGSTYGGYGQP